MKVAWWYQQRLSGLFIVGEGEGAGGGKRRGGRLLCFCLGGEGREGARQREKWRGGASVSSSGGQRPSLGGNRLGLR